MISDDPDGDIRLGPLEAAIVVDTEGNIRVFLPMNRDDTPMDCPATAVVLELLGDGALYPLEAPNGQDGTN